MKSSAAPFEWAPSDEEEGGPLDRKPGSVTGLVCRTLVADRSAAFVPRSGVSGPLGASLGGLVGLGVTCL